MNEQLKFSWGHIIAFLALIVISYISFVGVTYKTDGNFTKASVVMIAIDVILFVFFIGAQMMKSTTKKFSKRIWVERILIFGSPIIFLVCMLPYFHFGSVHSQDEVIVTRFKDAVSASKQMFDDYESYSNERISNYERMLDEVIANRDVRPDQFYSCGFSVGNESIQKFNMVKSLRLQLLSDNYNSLKSEANKWIESSSKGASTWNVFLLGNTKEIEAAIHDWNAQLCQFASHKMNNEEFCGYNKVKSFNEDSSGLASVDKTLDELTILYTNSAFPPVGSIVGAIVLYFALLFPYVLQDRHTKSQFRLIGMERGVSHSDNVMTETTTHRKGKQHKSNITTQEKDLYPSPKISKEEDDDYASFTM